MNTLKLTLLENAHHSIERSLMHARDAAMDKKEWKFGILLLIQALELIFKEILRREHPVLIFENIDTQKHTVSISSAIKRLEKIAHVKFSQSDVSAINTAIHWRNQLMHYECELNVIHAKKTYYKLIVFLRALYKERFNEDLETFINKELWAEIIEIKEFLSQAMTVVEEKITNNSIESEWVWECRNCGQLAFVVQDDENICYLCGYVDEVECCESCGHVDYLDNMHEVYSGNARGLDHWGIVCSECDSEFARMRENEENDYFY